MLRFRQLMLLIPAVVLGGCYQPRPDSSWESPRLLGGHGRPGIRAPWLSLSTRDISGIIAGTLMPRGGRHEALGDHPGPQ